MGTIPGFTLVDAPPSFNAQALCVGPLGRIRLFRNVLGRDDSIADLFVLEPGECRHAGCSAGAIRWVRRE